MFASPFLRRRLGALLLICLVAVTALLLVPTRSSGAGHVRTHVVQPGDTVWSIALARYDGDPRAHIASIAGANDLRGAVVHVGQRLVLP